jgi:hypothetical protein
MEELKVKRSNRKWTPVERQVVLTSVMYDLGVDHVNKVMVESGFKPLNKNQYDFYIRFAKRVNAGEITIDEVVFHPTPDMK